MRVKLVRSRMKKMIEASGKYKTVNISRGMYKQLLAEKLIEEAEELAEAIMSEDDATVLEEYADLATVLDAVLNISNFKIADVVTVHGVKKDERGDFQSNLGIILED